MEQIYMVIKDKFYFNFSCLFCKNNVKIMISIFIINYINEIQIEIISRLDSQFIIYVFFPMFS